MLFHQADLLKPGLDLVDRCVRSTPFHELVRIGETSGGVILPKSELRAERLLDEVGNVVDDQQLTVTQIEADEWEIETVEAERFQVVD